MSETEKLNNICYWLIRQCMLTEAVRMTIEQEHVTFEGKGIGDWKITVERIKE